MAVKKVNFFGRLTSMVLDYATINLFLIPFALPFFIIFGIGGENNTMGELRIITFPSMIFITGVALFFCKDSLQGRSFGKRLLKLQVVDNYNRISAGPLRCMVRNLFIIIWPLELLITLFSRERRLGDIVAGTRVVRFDENQEPPEIDKRQLIQAFFIAYAVCFAMLLVIEMIIPTHKIGDMV